MNILNELITVTNQYFPELISKFNELVLKEKEESGFWQELAITFASWQHVADKILFSIIQFD